MSFVNIFIGLTRLNSLKANKYDFIINSLKNKIKELEEHGSELIVLSKADLEEILLSLEIEEDLKIDDILKKNVN